MIEILRETTSYPEFPNAEGGIYFVDNEGALVAFKTSKGIYREYGQPIRAFSKSRRKFEHIKWIKEPTDENVIYVEGSKGNTYTIINGQCSCPGFKYRGKCKHVTNLGEGKKA